MANFITSIRILCSIALVFCDTFSSAFYVLYALAGFSDMIDGTVARKTNSSSEFGEKFDTIADFIFVVVCLFKIVGKIDIPIWLYIWIGVIAFIKIINVIVGYVIHKKMVAVHSVLNKITGGLLFVLPFTIRFLDIRYSGVVICVVATIAAVFEGYLIIKNRNEI